jgi:hypothetical protein
MIRDPKFGDIPRIYELLVQGHTRSRYAGSDEISKEVCKGNTMLAIRNHGKGMFLMVAENEATQRVEGFVMGSTDRLYGLGVTLLETTMMHFYASSDVDPRDPERMFDAYVAWAKSIPNVVHIRACATDIIGDYKAVARFFRNKGFTQTGVIFGMEINDGQR